MDLLSQARGFAQAIEDDRCCVQCLLEFSNAISADSEQLDGLRRDCHAFWDVCIRVVTVSAQDDQTEEGSRLLCGLGSAAAACSRHEGSTIQEDDHVKAFVAAACQGLHVCLAIGERSAVSRAKAKHKAFSNKRGAWPMTQEHLFPSGADDAGMLIDVLKLKSWTLCVMSPGPALLLADLLYIAHPLVFPALIEDRHPLVSLVGRWVHNPVAELMLSGDREADDAALQLHDQQTAAAVDPLVSLVGRWVRNPVAELMLSGDREADDAALQLHDQQTAAAVALLRSLRAAPDADPDAFLQFTLEREGYLFNCAQRGLKTYQLRHGPGADLEDDIADLAAAMHPRLAQPDSVLLPEVRARLPAVAQLDLAEVLHVLLEALAARSRICGGPQCARSVHASADPNTTFSRCARCRLVHYCSPACQRDDWKTGRGIPHKEACHVFCMIASVTDYKLPREQFRGALEPVLRDTTTCFKLSFVVCSFANVLPMEVTVRASQLHGEAATPLGMPNVFATASRDFVENISTRQAQCASGV